MSYDYSMMSVLPVEIIHYILLYLPLKYMVRCRSVCFLWKEIVDDITRRDRFWKKYCERDFRNIYKRARLKCRPSMNSCDLYRTLSFWPKILDAREEQEEFCTSTCVQDEIKGFTVLRNGVLGIHKRTAIMYYDVESFKPIDREEIPGDYLRYSENQTCLVVLCLNLHLYIARKVLGNLPDDADLVVEDVNTYILLDHALYLIDAVNDLYICDFSNKILSMELVTRALHGVMALSYNKNGLHKLTYERHIYTLIEKKFVFVLEMGATTNILQVLGEYNFLEVLEWRIYFQWMFILNHSIPQGPLQDIVAIRTYGDMVFVGCNWGVFRIYHRPYLNEEFNIFKCEPLKQYNFMEYVSAAEMSMCPVMNIDVYEIHDGHIVVVAMPKKIIRLIFSHKEPPSEDTSLSIYTETASIKIISVD